MTDDEKALFDQLRCYLNAFSKSWKDSRQRDLVALYLMGLMSDLKRKTLKSIAMRFKDQTGIRNLQMFFNQGKVLQDVMLAQHQHQVVERLGQNDGMVQLDGCDFKKKGSYSAGVARQYCEELKRKENCQAGLFLGYSSRLGDTLMDRRLYMPEKWFDAEYRERCEACGVPKNLTFQTKGELALAMLRQAKEIDVPFHWIGCDRVLGSDEAFLSALPKGCYYFSDVGENQLVFTKWPDMIRAPAQRGRKRKDKRASLSPVQVSSLAQEPTVPWEWTSFGDTMEKTKKLRVIRTKSAAGSERARYPVEEVWLYIRQAENSRIRSFFSNAPVDIEPAELDRVSGLRLSIKPCFDVSKRDLGMDHYEFRSWNAWHLHMLLVMMAHLFTTQIQKEPMDSLQMRSRQIDVFHVE